jgi:hypothetical protein
MAEVLIARKSTIGLEATPGSGFNRSSSTIAFRPKGVAALPSPKMLAAKFITIELMAGWSGGTSGKRRRSRGASFPAIHRSRPPSRAIRITPSMKIMMPVRRITSSTPALALA